MQPDLGAHHTELVFLFLQEIVIGSDPERPDLVRHVIEAVIQRFEF